MLREIANDFYMNQNYNCGECILRAANKAYDLGLDERALKLASGFGAGMEQKASRNSVQNMLTLSRLPSAVITAMN